MKKTNHLTLGALLLALIAAMSIFDKISGGFFVMFVGVFISTIIVFYNFKVNFKACTILAFSSVILCLILMDIYSFVSIPISAFIGVLIAYLLNKNISIKKIKVYTSIGFIINEIIYTYLIMQLLGFNINDEYQAIQELINSFNLTQSISIPTFYLITCVIFAIVMAYLTVVIIQVVLIKFKLYTFTIDSVFTIKPTKKTVIIREYAIFILYLLAIYFNYIQKMANNYIDIYIVLVSLYYIYSGYMCSVIISRFYKLKFVFSFLLLAIIFINVKLILIYVALGFVYNSGALYNYIVRKLYEKKD